ncbi:hypothetical protein EYF80_039958 [Liparis tanakae]|uniref:Uncharacterized protein n=1 Tax=Liparis tanakae TaxID=230148 RepID=A0A4Z2GAI2_9TELE|nr:hypothetical protein EYF80_039958 [Liparis tanakae]
MLQEASLAAKRDARYPNAPVTTATRFSDFLTAAERNYLAATPLINPYGHSYYLYQLHHHLYYYYYYHHYHNLHHYYYHLYHHHLYDHHCRFSSCHCDPPPPQAPPIGVAATLFDTTTSVGTPWGNSACADISIATPGLPYFRMESNRQRLCTIAIYYCNKLLLTSKYPSLLIKLLLINF